MAQSYSKLADFAAALKHVQALAERLESGEMSGWEHSAVELHIFETGNEALRLLFQGYLDQEAARETMLDSVEDESGTILTHRRENCCRRLTTVFGKVKVHRRRYSFPGTESLFPLDGVLNLPNDQYSHCVRRRIAEAASRGSYDAAVATVAKASGANVPKRQAEELAVRAAQDFEAFYESQGFNGEFTLQPLIITLDGKGIVMREDGLREVTRNAARSEKHKLQTRLSRGEKRYRKRMSTVAAVYTVRSHVRTPEQIMRHTVEDLGEKRPRAENKRVWASVEREALAVTREALNEAVRRDPFGQRPWAVLIDGQEQQLSNVEQCLSEFGAKATLILDFIHVLEYLWKAAYCFHPEGSETAETWVAQRALQILRGKGSDVAAGIRRSATLQQLDKEKRKAADTCADYLLKYKHLMRYDEYLAAGLPIATGVIEGACRHLVKDRMDITGARWGLNGAEAILKLRSLQSSGHFDDYWDFHLDQEFERHHLRYYKNFPLTYAAA